ncbi:MAG: adenylate/guanylate cyclase domain-containing protein [SAR202 cluster bacterium]|nr:adenylate/guanylate cyclase domain-containing protein [SAR202 cluster bacterium]MDP6664510.1 adenylate/guanylate cyclase domain-containing protein [SAR202 cluster bacterium]MQG58751.1 adenylate/guanylate cyclase domain-containing protein [SAR202 cluster bacterium]MQG67370.1 adenylate/guanylate cyclase domain-containing protein [SAR202 cluster bacterium]HAL46300.1 hypothetical protein [Dehalococcoidia bacterium]
MGHLSPVSVLFADARGFTSLIHEHGPEEITPFIDEFFKRCYNIVINHDGIMDHFRGDAILGFFNVPIRHDDHVARAVAAAAEIQAAVPEINLSKGRPDLLKIGAGITTGMALTATVGSNTCTDYTVMGDVANIASRLQGVAKPGEILVSADVYDVVAGTMPGAEKRVLELKGIDEPYEAYVLP